MPDTMLVINAGSSSIKFQLFDLMPTVGQADPMPARLRGQIEGIGTQPRLLLRSSEGCGAGYEEALPAAVEGMPNAMTFLGNWLREWLGGVLPVAVGHRVVHGGPAYDEPIVVDDAAIETLERYAPLAPLHQPHNLAPIRAIRSMMPGMVQVACFDTAFHRRHPEVADRYAIPEQLYREGVRRYGFHGLSYEWIARRLHDVAPLIAHGRVIIAHLGSGASMCAIQDGVSIDSTMGFTALDGLPMGTRPGQLDPGIVLYLLSRGMDAHAIEQMLYRDCGLKGLSGFSNDVRDLLGSPDPRASLALEVFIYRASLAIGSLTAALGGLDALVFTAGIGEHSAVIRSAIAERSRWIGLVLDETANLMGRSCISSADSQVQAYVIPTDEERMIATHTSALLARRR
ncbi:acetate/propionate family kinase [Azospirillum sp. CT11-132]|uniref:acetate/propionate family kinase n=1 Tax=Azospirillum sp. CT11-132 TaxID=3396317 RepID=UPI0039A6665B